MVEMELKILNEEGLHARPAGVLAKTAAGFKSQIELEFNGKRVNAKSLLSLMALGLKKDSSFRLHASGDDATHAAESIKNLVSNRFG